MKKYPLSFASAFKAMQWGSVVASEHWDGLRMRLNRSTLEWRERNGADAYARRWTRDVLVTDRALKGGWRIVPTKGHPNV